MKEILYFQAGTAANYVGTHFWNTQECYLNQDVGDGDETAFVDHERSFLENVSGKGEVTYCPRLLLFDRKANFGAISGLGGPDVDDALLGSTWAGEVVQYTRDQIPRSKYQEQLDEEGLGQDGTTKEIEEEPVRYWSEFNRVYYHSRSLQRLPDTAEWENNEGHWAASKELFARQDTDTELMDDTFRKLLEGCDLLQGIQVTHDTSTFGGFTDAFLLEYRDLFPKLSALTFPILSNAAPGSIDVDDNLAIRKTINDAQCLRSLVELSSMTVPIQPINTWTKDAWCSGLDFDISNMYHTSAILSAHIESSTLPIRLERTSRDLSEICAQLNWRGSTRIAHLAGAFVPATSLDKAVMMYDFSSREITNNERSYFAHASVMRGITQEQIDQLDSLGVDSRGGLSVEHNTNVSSYPIPTSFPRIFESTSHAAKPKMESAQLLSSLSTSMRTAPLLRSYALFIEDAIRRKADLGADMGIERDEMHELASDLWTLHDGYAEEEDANHEHEDTSEDDF